MNRLEEETAAFRTLKAAEMTAAHRRVAVQLTLHADLDDIVSLQPEARARLIMRLKRSIERERQRGIRRHWGYDLNRHIAMKEALEGLRA